MKTFVLSGLLVFLGAVLTMITVQLIRIERKLTDLCAVVEVKVRELYKKGA
jgi:hypothetical protein